MNGIDQITARILAGADEQANAILAEAKNECDRIRKENSAFAQKAYQERMKAGKDQFNMTLQQRKKAASLNAKKNQLATKQELVAKVFETARERLLSLPEDEYAEFLAGLAAGCARTGHETVDFSEKEAGACAEKVLRRANELLAEKGLPGELVMGGTVSHMSGGLIVRDGNIETNCSIDLLVEQKKSEMSREVADYLFA